MKFVMSILFVSFTFFFLTSTASASLICIQGEIVPCSENGCKPEVSQDSQECDLEEMEKALRRLKRVTDGMRPHLEELQNSSKDVRDRLEAHEAILNGLPEEFMGRDQVIELVEELLKSSKDEVESKIDHLLRYVMEQDVMLSQEIQNLENKISNMNDRLSKTQLLLGMGVMTGTSGIFYGATVDFQIVLGQGSWFLDIGGMVGESRVYDTSGFGYGFILSVLTKVAGGADWVINVGPAILAEFNAGSGVVGFSAFTAGGGVKAELNYNNLVKMSVTPFVGWGGVKDPATGAAKTGIDAGGMLNISVSLF